MRYDYTNQIKMFKKYLEVEVKISRRLNLKTKESKKIRYYQAQELFDRLQNENIATGGLFHIKDLAISLSVIPANTVDEIISQCRFAQFSGELMGIFIPYESMKGKDLILISDKLLWSDDRFKLIVIFLHEIAHYVLTCSGFQSKPVEYFAQNLGALGIDNLSKDKTNYIVKEFSTNILVESWLLEYNKHHVNSKEYMDGYLKEINRLIDEGIQHWNREINEEVYGDDTPIQLDLFEF